MPSARQGSHPILVISWASSGFPAAEPLLLEGALLAPSQHAVRTLPPLQDLFPTQPHPR